MNEIMQTRNAGQASRPSDAGVSHTPNVSPPGSGATLVSFLTPWSGRAKAPEDRRTAKAGANSPERFRAIASWSSAVLCRFGFSCEAFQFVRRIKGCAPVLTFLAMSTTATWAKDLSIAAELEPSEITYGDSAQLTVNIRGRQTSVPNPPSVPGLSFEAAGQSSQIQIINGAMSANVSHTFIVTPNHPGTFTIPKFKVGSGAEAAESNPLVLKVLKRSGAAVPQQNGGSAAINLPAPAVNGARQDLPAIGRNEIGFLRMVAPKMEFYVGEMAPIELKAYFRAGVELRVDGLPQLNSDAFTMNKLGEQPARSQEIVNGEPFTVFTWPTAITAVKAGNYDVAVEIPTTVTVRQRAARPRSPFGNSFFDDAFNDAFFDRFPGSATQKQIKLSSAGMVVKIQSLSTENRPASFAGAVGKFDITAAATPTRASAGDPITLKLNITGRGNFDRVSAPSLESSDVWKTYKPSAKFEAEDSAGYEGIKTFEMTIVPQQSGKLEIPALEFSYFDPEQKAYVTRASPPQSVEIAPGASGSTPLAKASTHETVPANVPVANVDDLAPNKLAPGSFTSSLRPWFTNPWLAGTALSPLPLMAGAMWMMRRRDRRANDPTYARSLVAHRAVREQLDLMESAVKRGECEKFFSAARSVLQHRLGQRWGMRPDTITLAEINARMNGEADGFRPIFELADEVIYTGRTFGTAELQSWARSVNTELLKLEAK